MSMKFTVYCEDYDFSPLAAAFDGEFVSDCPLAAEVAVVDGERIRELNRDMRSVDAVTDVLSFPAFAHSPADPIKREEHLPDMDEQGNLLIGCIAICRQRAEEQAAEYGHSFGREINYLAAHGVCHLLGYDHIEDGDRAAMRGAEERVLAKIGLSREGV